MLLTNWLKTLTSRLRRRTVVRSRDRRALRRYWLTVLNNQISTVEVLEDRTMLTTITGTTPDGTVAEEDHPVNQYGAEAHWIPINYSESEATLIAGEAPPFSVSDTFNLSSLSGANHTIYLDFNGHTTTGTYWNEYYASGSSIVTPAYDTDGNVAVFSTAEHEAMQRVWQRVAEDFAPFHVNVTTVEPPTSDLIKSNTSDTRWGVRVVIGENTFYDDAGGVAFRESFNWNTDTPAFVFNTEMSEVALAVTHEAGHTLGLTHDGTSTEEYYRGHGSGTTGWAPIMGVGYYQNLVQWSKGEYTDSSNNQDDLSIITTQNGFGYRADDHGSSIGTASTVTSGMASGIVERNTDVDYFQFTTNGGDVLIDPFIEEPNLDILARLYDAGGALIQTSNPVGALNASFTGLSAGTYYVSIEGTGEGSVSGTGYSDYGSLGQYTITFSAQVPTLDVISDMTLTENASLQTVNLSGITAGLGESQPLRVMASSSNTDLIRDPLVSYTSPDGTGTLTFTPIAHQRGTATITVTVEDGGLDGDLDTPNDNVMFSRTFDVTVNAVNGVPTIFSQGELLPDPAANPAAGDETGNAVAVDGDWMVVAAASYDDREGIVYLYVRNDVNQTPDDLTDDTWDFHSTIYAPTNGVEPGYYFFGQSVAIDGNVLIIGASYADDGDLAGSVYLYELNEGADPGHEDDVWVHQRTFTQPADGLFGAPFPRGFGPSVSNFGHSLAIQGQTIVVGAPNADVDETAKRAGAVYVFMTDDGWNTYSTSKLTASDATEYAYFGEAVAISEDENTIIAGDPYHNFGDPSGYQDGAVYLFSRDTSGTASPGDDNWSEFKMLTAVETDSRFGSSVDIENGIAVIGSDGDAYVIQESENWDVLTSLAGIGEAKPVRFGWGVAISGDVILVGSPDYNNPADPGSIYLFDGWNGWGSPDLEQLYALDPNLNESLFTESIAISGGTIIAGWRNHAHDGVQTGAAYAYEYQPVIDLKADITDGSLVINNLTNENASVSLSVSEGALVVTHPDNRLVPPVEGNQVNLTQFTIPLSALISGEIYINGGTGSEFVSVDASLESAGLRVIFTGGEGGGFDSLELTGTASSAEYLFENEHDGKIQLNGSGLDLISYTGLEPITSSIDAAQVTLAYSDADETITVSSPASGQLSVDSTAGEIITFQNFSGKLTLDAGAGINTLILNDLGASLTADFEILDSAGTETVILGDTLNLGSGKTTIAAETVQIAGAVTGAGDVEIAATTIEFANTNSSLNTGDGDLSLLAENTINLGEVISTGTVEITSLNGDINDNNDGLNNITASRAILSAVNGLIGSTLETEVRNLEAVASGGIDITNTGDLIIGGISGLEGIESAYGAVRIFSFGSIEVQENVSSYTNLLLWTQDSAVASLDEDILVHSGVRLYSETNYVALYADDDLTVEEQVTLETLSSNIYLRVNYDSADGVGGVLNLAGDLVTQSPTYRAFVYGSTQADTFWIAPCLNSQMIVNADTPASPDLIGDTLNYLLPDGETATPVPSSDANGTISFTGGYQNIFYNNVETLQQGDLSQLAGQLRIEGTAANDVLTINATDSNSGTWQLNAGPVVAFSAIDELAFYGLTGDDRLVINHPDGAIFNPAGGILFDAGGQAGDELELTGGTVQSVQHRLDEGQNAIYLNGSVAPTVRYQGVGTVIADTDAVATTVVGDSLTVSSDDGVQTRVTGNTGVLFTSYSGLLAVEGISASATIQLNSLGSGVSGTLLIGGNQQETVILNDGLNLGSADLTIRAGSAQVTGEVTRASDLQIEANTITFADANSGIDAGSGNIELISSEDLIVGNLTTTGAVVLTSLNGDIRRVNAGAFLIKAFSAVMSAEEGGIGSSINLVTELSHLEAIAYGEVVINNTGDLIIGGGSDLVGIETLAGGVNIYNHGSLKVCEDVISFGSLYLRTLDDTNPSANSNLIVDSGVFLQGGSSISLVSSDDLLIEQNALLTSFYIGLFLDSSSDDVSGGRLDLLGELVVWGGAHARIYGGDQADSYYISPSQRNRIQVYANAPTSPGDTLYYYTPEGVTATLSSSSTTVGTVSFSDGYQEILHVDVENIENAGTPPEPDPAWVSVAGTSGNDILTVNATDSNSGTWQLNDGPVNTFSNIESFTFFGLAGDDRLVINNPVDSVFHPTGGINYGGGTGGETLGDSLEIIGGGIEDSEFEFIAENRGRIFYGEGATPAINHFNLEELSSELSVTNQQIYYSFPGTRPLIISDAGAGVTAFDTRFGTPLKLISPIETLALQFGNNPLNVYQINLNSLGAGFSADLIINDRDDNTSITLGDGLNLGSGAVSITAETVQVAGTVTGNGDLDVMATTIDFPNTNSSLNTGDGNLRLQSENSINLGEVISTGLVEITSITGDITDNNDSANNIAASRAILSAVNGHIGYTLETEVGNLEAVASGDIDITNTGDLIIGGVSELEGIESTYGRVIVRSFGGIEVQENVSSYTNLLLWTQDSAVASLDEDILVHSGVTLQSETNYVALYADDDVTVQEQALLQTTANHIHIHINYDSADGVGGVLDLAGKLITQDPSYRTLVWGSSQADSYQIVPSLDSRIIIQGYLWSQTETLDDELIYYIPQGEVATHNISGPDQGQISFSGSYQDIGYNNVHTHFLAGSLTLEGTAGDDVLTINATDFNSGTFQFNEGPVVAFTDLSDLTFRGLEGDDRLVINHPSEGLFAPLGGVLFEGGGQTTEDTLEIYGGTASSVEHRFINENDGSIFYNGQTTAAITYTGLEPVLDTIAATDRSFSFTGDAETITLSDEGDAGDGESMIDSTLGESVVFTHPTGTLTINTEVFGGTGSDTIIVNPVDSTFTANLTINAGNDDTVTLNTIDSGSGNVELNANEIDIDGTLTTSGMVAIQADSLIRFAETGVIDATANTVQLTAGLSIQLGKIITAGDVWLTSTGGAILDGTLSESSLVQSNSLFLQAATGIGGAGDADIDIEANHITADSYQGPLMIENFGDLFVQLSELPDLILNEDAGEQTIPLSLITTAGGTSQPLSVTATSSQPSLIANSQINYVAGDTTDSLVFTPEPEQTGTATITLIITDGGVDHLLETTGDNRSIELTFDITVNPQNDDPELDQPGDLLVSANAPEQTVLLSGITAGGGEVQPLRVTAESNNPGLIADPVVNYTSADATGSLSFTPVADQTGTATITVIVEDGGLDGDLGTTADNATLTRTFVVTVRVLETVSLRVMDNPTATDGNGETESLSAEVDWLGEWDSYWLELWVSTEDLSSQGIASVSLDLAYLTDLTSATGIEFGAAFNQNQSGFINDENGLVEGLSATTDLTDLGINTQLLFARIQFESLAEDNVLLDLEGQRIGPYDLGLQIQTSQIGLGSERVGQNANVDHSAAAIWANPYDLNDDGQISFRDLLLFASVYNSITAESSSQLAWFSDFNQSGRVAFRDLVLLATNYNKSKLQQQEVIYPNNYPQDWDQQLQVSSVVDAPSTATELTQDQAQTALQSAADDVRPKLSDEGQQKLSQVQVEVVDLSGNTLGRVEGDTIYLDVNAAGHGWFVDQTPRDHSEFQYNSQLSLIALPDSEAAGLIDLWTVIRHELGHLLGYEHTDDGLMEAVLDPGERKLADWSEETDDFFASLEDDTELLSF
ncbi:Ig-like domain-containing protein [Gimesia sp.]|uniref:beta strand repeat-containing protein n=1 Tax=Gimesia sp. TaxID=2024833 RepID=UPI0032EAE3B0